MSERMGGAMGCVQGGVCTGVCHSVKKLPVMHGN